MRIVKAGLLHFVLGAGFILGPIRVLWVVPRLGARRAELVGAPIMLVITVVVARWIVRRFAPSPAALPRLGIGCIALCLMLIAEYSLVLRLRGM